MKYFGVEGYTSAIDQNLDLADYLAGRIEAHADLTLMAAPSLSIVCFRYAPASTLLDDAERTCADARMAIETGSRAAVVQGQCDSAKQRLEMFVRTAAGSRPGRP